MFLFRAFPRLVLAAVCPPSPTIQILKVCCQSVTIWTEQNQILFLVVGPITINVVDRKRNNPCDQVSFAPPTFAALFAVFFIKVPTNVFGDQSDRRATDSIPGFPLFNILFILKVRLTAITAKLVIPSFRCFTTAQAQISRFWRVWHTRNSDTVLGMLARL